VRQNKQAAPAVAASTALSDGSIHSLPEKNRQRKKYRQALSMKLFLISDGKEGAELKECFLS